MIASKAMNPAASDHVPMKNNHDETGEERCVFKVREQEGNLAIIWATGTIKGRNRG
jgi:hypothetical protein